MPEFSVIICTHDPRPEYLRRTLNALKAQVLPKERWELLVIDNASKEPLAKTWDLSWHLEARLVREDKLGLTHARLRGIRESAADLLVFVDDDNVLDPSYLEACGEIARKYPFLGAWGGIIEPEFEIPPPAWLDHYRYLLALRQVASDRWSNLTDVDVTMPYGAGLCVRKQVAASYAARVASDKVRLSLGRIGQSLGCAEDLDIALTAIDLEMGTGLFRALKMRHIIPRARLVEAYLLGLIYGNRYSGVVLSWSRGRVIRIPRLGRLRDAVGHFRRLLTMPPRKRRFFEAGLKGQQSALRDIDAWQRTPELGGSNH